MNRWSGYDKETERLVEPVHDELQYCGRIDDEHPDAPVFTMPASFVRMAFTGSSYVKAVVINKRYYNRSFLGVLLDETQNKVEIVNYDSISQCRLGQKHRKSLCGIK